ncbi:hypothetical protein COM59_26390 [Bacillus pseudomycoides]|nr:hypothetical protein COM59_26390 [Bacillus pseudomycoides]
MLFLKRLVNLVGIENLVLPEDAELAKSLRNKKENYIKNQFLLSRIATKKNVEGKTKEFYETCKEYEACGEKEKECDKQLKELIFKKKENDRVQLVVERMREVGIKEDVIQKVLCK